MTDRAPLHSRPPTWWLASLIGAAACLVAGCYKARDEQPRPTQSCAGNCHGGADSPAPPTDTSGNSDPSSPGVGAHGLHLRATNPTFGALACESCHIVPKQVHDPGHLDNPPASQLNFTGAALLDGRQPYYDPATRSCVDTYCHTGPRSASAPWPSKAVWNQPRGSEQACGDSCHALPPGGTHPSVDRCELCHGQTAGPGHTIKDLSLHINGKVEVSAGGCNSCHGNDKNAAPPSDLSGSSDTTQVTVGAHQKHLAGGSSYLPAVPCSTCHKVPASLDAPGHIDTPSPAELTFSAMATAGGVVPVWDRETATCTNVYCHGATLSGGTAPNPVWTKVDGKQGACGACHGVPPPPPHPQYDITLCAMCHRDAVDPNTMMPLLDKHINGQLELYVGNNCTLCHGGPAGPAPPKSLKGATEPTDRGVGAHQVHLSGGAFSRRVACVECHVVPTQLFSPGHIDDADPFATLTFSGVSLAAGAAPAWDPATATCANTYCHGEVAWAGGNSSPIWNKPGTVQCGGCHSIPPADHFPTGQTPCSACHGSVVDSALNFVDREKHINGVVDY
jgi:predicted CxxxxCH...CXXCH cytochrome family protein